MIRAVSRFQIQSGAENTFEIAFRDAGMFERPKNLDGFVSMELIKSTEDPAEYLVISTWKTTEDYLAWQGVSTREAPREALARLSDTLINPEPGKSYFIVRSE